jgi:hypothetical protein
LAGNRWTEAFQSLRPPAQVATLGALAIPVSMVLPWYGIPLTGGLAKTGFDSFGWGQLALLLTVGAVLYLIVRCLRGYVPPRPLGEGGLIAAGGAWSAVLVGYLMLDKPDRFAGFTEIHLRYGIFVAMGGAVAMIVGGLRLRAAHPMASSHRPGS